uniref:G-protein coupled receptors family 1 profile domain-containing protein n=1 Tax=Acrobeloides nanus TaxID=290746 RepID=A0A914EFU1_9BILA
MCASEVSNALWVIGSQWAALITLILGFERFVAVKWPIYYMNAKKNYTRILLISLMAILISLTIALCLGFFIGSEKSVDWACSISSAYGHTYSSDAYALPECK